MKATYFFGCLLILITGNTVSAQSVYRLEYNFHQSADSVTYHAFLLRYDDGSGLLRVRYTPASTAQDVLVEMDIEEDFVTDTLSGKTDTSILFLQATRARFIIGNNSIVYTPPVFQFGYNAGNGFYEPSGVAVSKTNPAVRQATSFTATQVEGTALNKELVAAFYAPDEDFYLNLFKSPGRGLSALEKNIRLSLLVVADTMDATIGTSCAMDLRRTTTTFKSFTDRLGMQLDVKIIAGNNYSKSTVQTSINQLKPGPNDIVVFYYSGHGFRKDSTRRFPNIKLKTNHTSRQDVFNNSLNIEDIFMLIKKKGARCNLVFSDCCNNDIETTNITGTKPGKTKGTGDLWDENNFRNLFLNNTPVSVLATAADNGQRASGNKDFGGFFSYFLTSALVTYCSKAKTGVSWDLVLQDAKTQTVFKAKHTYCDKPYVPANICNQYPYYIVR